MTDMNYDKDILYTQKSTFAEVLDVFKNGGSGPALIALAVLTLFVPYSAWVTVPIGVVLALIAASRDTISPPLFMPRASNQRDVHDLDPGKRKPMMARGSTYLGSEVPEEVSKPRREVWNVADMETQHYLVLGTTGAGKTEFLLGQVFNSLLQGSGCVYVDGKAETKLVGRIYAIARRLGREDDVLVISYLTGNQDLRFRNVQQLTNTFNPLVYGSSSVISEMLKSMLASTGGSGGDSWRNLAEQFLDALVRPLVFLRDVAEQPLTVGRIRSSLDLHGVGALFREIAELKPMLDSQGIKVPQTVTDGLAGYIRNLPGIKAEHADMIIHQGIVHEKLPQTVMDQHGYRSMQLIPVLSMLADEYGHIFEAPRSDVDMWDVLTNRRILIVLLPALEKSPSSMANLGKIILAAIKSMLGMALGHLTDGDLWMQRKSAPLKSKTPFKIILDEVGYYFVEGIAVTAAQARSLGCSFIYGAQDLPALKKGNEKEAGSVIGNTNTKIVGRIEDAQDSMQMISARAGHVYRKENKGYEKESTELGVKVMKSKSIGIERREAITVRDVESLSNGRFICMHGPHRFTFDALFTGAIDLRYTQNNTFVDVEPPTRQDIEEYVLGMEQASAAFERIMKQKPETEVAEDLVNASKAMDMLTGRMNPLNAAMVALERYRAVALQKKKDMHDELRANAKSIAASSEFGEEVVDVFTTPRGSLESDDETSSPRESQDESSLDRSTVEESLRKLHRAANKRFGSASPMSAFDTLAETTEAEDKESNDDDRAAREARTITSHMAISTQHPVNPHPERDKGLLIKLLAKLLE
ncbi:TraM recognition domain-containing protein [Alcanivorax sp. 1008]|uniref:TraM recognition domain-containing protein n=1 Tax=Alcanivorax sp. 1008 TaxID=2816853 RepID=UPI001D7CB65D|nr:TraM recognition domain-containing protein [Alcanivorax sp. 1008]MCC1496792.1 TraM recognition domain-containing protein [Alcanivorax sp. 1008]